ncbi:hypothetical protein RSAG8_02086, partial [Rhizoctonia solani AG-8 WAC10335]
MLHANDSSPTKVHGSQMMRMKRVVFARAPQVSVVTRTIYASSTAITTNPPQPQTVSSTSIASSRYVPSRPSPLALNVVTRAPSVATDDPPTVVVTAPAQSNHPAVLSPQSAALRRLSPLPPKVQVVPPSPPPPAHTLPAPATDKNPRQSVQSVQSAASEYSLDSPVGVAYGGDELEQQPYTNPRDEWRASQDDVMSRMHAAAQARGPFSNA